MAGMYPDNQELTIFGEKVQWPGVDKTGKFTNGSFSDPLEKPSFIPAETINLILDNLTALIEKLGGTPDNTSIDQLAKLFTSGIAANKGIMRDSAGRAKVAAPQADDDIARKKEVDDVINGNVEFKKLTVQGDIIQTGANKVTHAEDVYTKNDMIHLREGAIFALADKKMAGLIAERYDSTNNGILGFDNSGTARVGDENDTQPLATRAEESEMSHGALVVWNGSKKRLETQGGTLITAIKSVNLGIIDYDKTVVIKADNAIAVTLGNGAYTGVQLKIINATKYGHKIKGTTAADGDSTLQASQIQTIVWNGSAWEGLSCPRIGEIYTQTPLNFTPKDLFICTNWTELSFGGAFFRSVGGDAKPFIKPLKLLSATSTMLVIDTSDTATAEALTKTAVGDLVIAGAEYRTVKAIAGNTVTIDAAFSAPNIPSVLIGQNDGLPNITGYVNFRGAVGANESYGAIELGKKSATGSSGVNWENNLHESFYFDASRDNKIYGNNAHVTPNNITIKHWLRIA